MRIRTRRPAPTRAGRGRPWRTAAALPLLGVVLLTACGGDPAPPKLTPPSTARGATQATPASATVAPVLTAERRWVDAKGNRFTILVTLYRPSNAGLNMCAMANGQFVGPSLVLSVRNDSTSRSLKGPQISVEDRMVAFPHGQTGCSFVFAPSDQETFEPGDSHTYRTMVMPNDQGRFADVVLRVTQGVRSKSKGGGLVTKELLRIPALKLYEAYRQGPVPTAPTAPGATQPGHH
jgi:hypothetical protein